MVYEIKDKFVDFNKWCKTCKYADLKKDKNGVMPMPCDECLGQGLNKNSTKPIEYVEDLDKIKKLKQELKKNKIIL